jgi:hypothetical protein
MDTLLNIDNISKFLDTDEKIMNTCSSNNYRGYLTCDVMTKNTMNIYVLQDDRLVIKETIDYLSDVMGMFINPQGYSLIIQKSDGVEELQRSWRYDVFDHSQEFYKNVSVMKTMTPGTRLIIMHEGKVVSDCEIQDKDIDKYL